MSERIRSYYNPWVDAVHSSFYCVQRKNVFLNKHLRLLFIIMIVENIMTIDTFLSVRDVNTRDID